MTANVVSNCAIRSLEFYAQDGTSIARISSGLSSALTDTDATADKGTIRKISLGPAETIVGLYGVCRPANVLYGLGFIKCCR